MSYAYFRLGRIDAQVIFDSADRRCLIDGVEKISKYQLQDPFYVDLIDTMRRHPSRPSIRRLIRAAIEKFLPIRRTPTQRGPKRVYVISAGRCPMSARRTVNGALLGVKSATELLGGSERWVRRHLN